MKLHHYIMHFDFYFNWKFSIQLTNDAYSLIHSEFSRFALHRTFYTATTFKPISHFRHPLCMLIVAMPSFSHLMRTRNLYFETFTLFLRSGKLSYAIIPNRTFLVTEINGNRTHTLYRENCTPRRKSTSKKNSPRKFLLDFFWFTRF